MNKQLYMSKDLNAIQQNPIEKDLNFLKDIEKIVPKNQSVKKAIRKKKAVVGKVVGKKVVAEKKPVIEKNQSKMYIDFPSSKVETSPSQVQTSQNKPTKISIIIQLAGLLEALIPNRELFRSFMSLIKVFISVAFTLSAIYASCRIYATIFEWLVDVFKKGFKWSLGSASSYFPFSHFSEISNNLLIQKVVSFLLGVEVQPPINTYKYLPDFVYNTWLVIKGLWSYSISLISSH